MLTRVLEGTERAGHGMLLAPLRARGPRLLAAGDWLEQHEYLRRAAAGHVVSMLALTQLHSEKAAQILSAARLIYLILRRHYRDHEKEALAVREIAVYLADHGKPVSIAGAKGKVTLLNGAERTEAALAPAGDKLGAKGPFQVRKGTKGIATVTLAGKPAATARFALK